MALKSPSDRPGTKTPVAISYSGGGSSEWLLRATLRGIIPRPEHFAVFFADTKDEHDWTYERVAMIEALCEREGVPFFRCSADPGLSDHLISVGADGSTRADHPPVWIAKDGGGRGRAQHRCTMAFKVAPMRRAQSDWLASLGVPKRIEKWIGFGFDEQVRALKAVAKQDVQWESLAFPVIRLRRTRAEQHAELREWAGSSPRFSMCTICPWKSPERWFATPEGQRARAYEVDEAIRDMSAVGLTDGDAYLTDRLIPVESLIRHGDPQPNLPGLESYCDTGACFL